MIETGSNTAGKDRPRRDSRQRALEAALALFEAQGVTATTIEEVRDRSGVSIGSLYHHFRSREGLLAALYQDLLARYRAVMAAELARCEGARALLNGFVQTHIAWAAANRPAAQFLAEYRHHPDVAAAEEELQAGTAAFMRPLLARITPEMKAGAIRKLPPELLLSLVVGPVQAWLRLWLDGQAKEDPQAAAHKLADLIWASLKA